MCPVLPVEESSKMANAVHVAWVVVMHVMAFWDAQTGKARVFVRV
jgi:hypothetical protein